MQSASIADGSDGPECLRCGACCFSTLDRYVRVTGDDYARLGDAAETFAEFIGNRCYMRMTDGHCAALERTAEGLFVCRLYDRRPNVCRDLERGSPACAAERELKAQRSQRLPLCDAVRHRT